eukprot:14489021-Alexandrium_andersonii.AAC.1
MSASLVGSEMCIRDSVGGGGVCGGVLEYCDDGVECGVCVLWVACASVGGVDVGDGGGGA